MWRVLLSLLLIGLVASSAHSQDPVSDARLFIEIPPGADLPDSVSARVNEILSHPTSTTDSKVVQARASTVTASMLRLSTDGLTPAADQKNVTIRLPGGRLIEVRGVAYEQISPSVSSWIGGVVSDSGPGEGKTGTVALALQSETISGTVNLPDAVYDLTPIGGDFVAIVKIDQSKARPDEPPAAQRYEKRTELDVLPVTDIRVLIGYTPAAKQVVQSQSTSIEQFIARILTEANASFINSDIPVRYTLAGSLALSYTEQNSWATDRDRFFNKNDEYMDDIFTERDNKAADLAMLLFSSEGYCGEVMAIHSSTDTAFAVVDVDRGCTGKYTFTHETGHLFGAEHDASNASVPSYKPYGHGLISGNAWRTIMAYQHNCDPCTRILQWSSPAIKYPPGSAEATGTTDLNDNARVIREESERLSKFR